MTQKRYIVLYGYPNLTIDDDGDEEATSFRIKGTCDTTSYTREEAMEIIQNYLEEENRAVLNVVLCEVVQAYKGVVQPMKLLETPAPTKETK
jgi:hypothetical protein